MSAVRWLLALVLVALLLGLAARHAAKVEEGGTAFRRWRPQLHQLGQGVDLSARHNYPHPPMMAVLLEPLALLPPLAGAMTWFALGVAFAGVALWQTARLVADPGVPFPSAALLVAALLALKPILDELGHGNVNLLVLVLLTSALSAYRRRRDFLAGLLFALAVACKVTPALFLPYLLWKRAWRALAGCVVGLALFLYPGVVPSARMGFAEHQRQLVSWYGVMARPYAVAGRVTTEYTNQSLPGTLYRLATPSPSFLRWVGLHPVAVRFDNRLALAPEEARWLLRGFAVLFLLLAAWACRTPDGRRDSWRTAAEASVVVLGMLLFSERTWKHHAVTLLLPVAVLVYQIAVGGRPARQRRWLAAALGVAVLLVLLPGLGTTRSRLDAAVDPGLAKLLLAHGAYTWAFVVLLAAVLALLRFDARKPPLARRPLSREGGHEPTATPTPRPPIPALAGVPQRTACR